MVELVADHMGQRKKKSCTKKDKEEKIRTQRFVLMRL